MKLKKYRISDSGYWSFITINNSWLQCGYRYSKDTYINNYLKDYCNPRGGFFGYCETEYFKEFWLCD